MQNNYRLIMINALLLLVNIISHAQNIAQTIDYKLKSNASYVIVGKNAGSTIIALNTNEGFKIKKYTDAMGEWSSMDAPSIPSNCTQLCFIKKDTSYVCFYEMISKQSSVFYTQLFDTNFKPLAEPNIFTSIALNKSINQINIEQSETKQKLALYYISRDDDDNGFVHYLFADANNLVAKWQHIALGELDAPIHVQMLLGGKTNMIAIAALTKQEMIEQLTLYHIKIDSTKKHKVDLQNTLFNYKIAQADAQRDKVVMCLVHANAGEDDHNFIKKIIFDCTADSIEKNADVHIGKISSKKNEIGNYANYLPRHIVLKSNNDVLLISEYFDMETVILGTEVNSLSTSGAPFRISRVMKKYDYGDVLLTSITAQDSVAWIKNLHKEQLTENDEGTYSSFALALARNKMSVVFNALDKNHTMQQATIDADGNAVYTILNDAKIEAYHLIPRKAKQISNSEMIVPCERQNIFSFVKIRF
jgi:hypothetical protein